METHKLMFKKYPKIHRLGAEETDGILLGKCYIEEKIDGANTSIWKSDDGFIRKGSRNNDVTGGEFNGFCSYASSHEGIQALLSDFPTYRLYGEWLVRHTIAYDETKYRRWYMYDINDETDPENCKRLPIDMVYHLGKKYDIDMPELFAVLENPKLEDIMHFVGQSSLGAKGEGVVIKNFEFVNKFGDSEYAKIVTQNFKEDNAIVFGGNNKHSDTYWEMWCVNKYVTVERVRKVMQKIQPTVNKKLGVEDTARIINSVYHDYICECIWEIQKKVPSVNFKKLSILSCRKAARIYQDILNDDLSVAYKN